MVGARNMFMRSVENYGIRYLGDGDCKGFESVSADQAYGPDFQIQKLECLGHVQKRMGTRLSKTIPKRFQLMAILLVAGAD